MVLANNVSTLTGVLKRCGGILDVEGWAIVMGSGRTVGRVYEL